MQYFSVGGSFLYSKINISDEDFELLKTKKIFYIGIGIEVGINPMHLELMKSAKLIATRSIDQLSRMQEINSNSIFVPDIVYSLQDQVKFSEKEKSVLVIPNISVVPKHNEPHWKHAAWNYFKSEYCQFLDYLVENNFKLNFFSMCNSATVDDKFAAIEIMNLMNYSNSNMLIHTNIESISDVTALYSKYSAILTQRFHGIVLSEMVNTKYIAIHHHDKLKFSEPHNGNYVSYYGLNKQQLIDQFNHLNVVKNSINSNVFNNLKTEVDKLLI